MALQVSPGDLIVFLWLADPRKPPTRLSASQVDFYHNILARTKMPTFAMCAYVSPMNYMKVSLLYIVDVQYLPDRGRSLF